MTTKGEFTDPWSGTEGTGISTTTTKSKEKDKLFAELKTEVYRSLVWHRGDRQGSRRRPHSLGRRTSSLQSWQQKFTDPWSGTDTAEGKVAAAAAAAAPPPSPCLLRSLAAVLLIPSNSPVTAFVIHRPDALATSHTVKRASPGTEKVRHAGDRGRQRICGLLRGAYSFGVPLGLARPTSNLLICAYMHLLNSRACLSSCRSCVSARPAIFLYV